jgi:hypothetical protein
MEMPELVHMDHRLPASVGVLYFFSEKTGPITSEEAEPWHREISFRK